ncbi:hypothetical protein [Rhizobium sp. Leaf386]|uniref:hypothetical protein n=1 Tax=Rhizobium sp. Leaf386 TaxID=1736359 RepID=UPI000714ABDD|nr:hypothetical protein [Rhizobium sp. Leaf386]KQS95349.1 hypothetical protein ASG50_25320 [Rhizobium sp. Leaf386]
MFNGKVSHPRQALAVLPPQDTAVHIAVPGQLVIADCVRKWMAGASLNEQERQVVDKALAENRFELAMEVFREVGDAR